MTVIYEPVVVDEDSITISHARFRFDGAVTDLSSGGTYAWVRTETGYLDEEGLPDLYTDEQYQKMGDASVARAYADFNTTFRKKLKNKFTMQTLGFQA